MGNGAMICNIQREDEAVDLNTGKCRIWSGVNHENFRYPELQECPEVADQPLNFGIALSGGGFRAASLSIGTLRGLYQLGIFSKSRYLSSNSGSSWVVGPLSYSQGKLSEFLGEYLPPEECTMTNLRKIDVNCHTYSICRGRNLATFTKKFEQGIFRKNDKDSRGFWSEAVGRIFFEQYDLNTFDTLPVISRSLATIQSQLPLPPNKFCQYESNRSPFPIINGSVIIRGKSVFAPVEFTPMYYSFPGHFHHHSGDNRSSVGGYLIEPFGFTANPTKTQSLVVKQLLNPSQIRLTSLNHLNPTPPSNELLPQEVLVDVRQPNILISVSDQAGISSSAVMQGIGDRISNKMGKMLDMTEYSVWNPINGECNNLLFADGGGCDNTGIVALLRRKVTKIFAMFAITQSIMNPHDTDEMNSGDLAGLFGVMTCEGNITMNGLKIEDHNRYHQVFPSEDYDRLIRGLRSRYVEGKPCSFLLRTQVLPSPFHSVAGNYSVDVLFMVSAPTDNWVNSLPDEVKKKILKQRKEVDRCLKRGLVDEKGAIRLGEGKDGEDDKDDEDDDSDDEDSSPMADLEELTEKIHQKFQKSLESASSKLSEIPTPGEIRETFEAIFKQSKFKRFPCLSTGTFDYTSQLANLMTNLMTWEVYESRDLFEELLGCPFEATSSN
jgi:hypothetical protein